MADCDAPAAGISSQGIPDDWGQLPLWPALTGCARRRWRRHARPRTNHMDRVSLPARGPSGRPPLRLRPDLPIQWRSGQSGDHACERLFRPSWPRQAPSCRLICLRGSTRLQWRGAATAVATTPCTGKPSPGPSGSGRAVARSALGWTSTSSRSAGPRSPPIPAPFDAVGAALDTPRPGHAPSRTTEASRRRARR
jgi:hypothetical protein